MKTAVMIVLCLLTLLVPAMLYAFDASPEADGAVSASGQLPQIAEAPQDVASAVETGAQTYMAIKAGDWKLAVSLIIMLLIFLVRVFWARMPQWALEWGPGLLGVLGTFALSLGSGASWGAAAREGFIVGAAANGLWAMVGKRILGSKLPDRTRTHDVHENRF